MKHGRRLVANAMYSKGKNFAMAGVLLNRAGGYEYVVLHCLCQALELVLKALLLTKDHAKFASKLKRPIAHDLMKAANLVTEAYNWKPLRAELRGELQQLSSLYARHLLRYGTPLDFLVDPATIPSRRVMRRFVALVKLTEPLFQG